LIIRDAALKNPRLQSGEYPYFYVTTLRRLFGKEGAMTISTSLLQREVEALHTAERHWQTTARRKHPEKAFTIALAREAGASGTEVAAEVAKRLNWPVYDQLLLERIAREMGLRTQLLESVDEKRKSWLLEVVEGFASAGVSELAYVRHLSQTILSLGVHGDCVIVGRGAAHILPKETTLRVRLVGNLEDRIASIARRLTLTKEQAAKWVAETDRQRQAFAKDHFLKDPGDPHNYDLVLNTSTWSLDDCADLILHGLRNLENRR
jgi:cytidylate kinase